MLAILFRWRVQSCGYDIVWLWRSHGSGHGLDHHTLATWCCAIAYLPLFELQSFHLLSLLLSFWYHLFLFLIISTLGNVVYSWNLHVCCCVHWHWEWRAQILIYVGSHNNYSGSCRVPSDILGWRIARWAWFSCNQGIAHPWLLAGLFISRGHHPGAPVDLFFNAAPPRRCPLLFFIVGHCHATLMSAGNNNALKMLTLQIYEILSTTDLT